MNIIFSPSATRLEYFSQVARYLEEKGIVVVDRDFERPWGGFFVIDEARAVDFAALFFPEVILDNLKISGKVSPKILMVQPGKRLSWQYHNRRAEIWKLVAGEAGVVRSDSDDEGELHVMKIGEIVRLKQGERHRLVGLDQWGMVAEIWQHTDAQQPSDESDIVRLQDDFGRQDR